MSALKQFENQKYINIETFRKNGEGVRTPVWFAQEGDVLYAWTESTSGKAKRIRRNGKVRVVPSNGGGEPRGDWVDANAVVSDSVESVEFVKSLFSKKYGFVFHIFRGMGKLRRADYVSVKIQVAG